MSPKKPPTHSKRAAMCWLIITAVNDHIMKCQSAVFPDAHPECQEKCCPNCCGTCFTLRWLRDEENAYVTRLLNQHDESLSDWQNADGSVDWSQIERHWDASGDACGREPCIAAHAAWLDATVARLAARVDEVFRVPRP